VSPLDPPAAAARRQWVLDRIVEDLVGWGCPLDHAPARARQLLDRVLDGGYTLPASVADTPPPAGHSTTAGRTRARILFAHHRGPTQNGITEGGGTVLRAHCSCRQWAGDWREHASLQLLDDDHDRHVAAMLVAGGVATNEEQARARPQRGAGAPNTGAPPPTPRDAPPDAHRGAQPVGCTCGAGGAFPDAHLSTCPIRQHYGRRATR
jgi:hypothetical protein